MIRATISERSLRENKRIENDSAGAAGPREQWKVTARPRNLPLAASTPARGVYTRPRREGAGLSAARGSGAPKKKKKTISYPNFLLFSLKCRTSS